MSRIFVRSFHPCGYVQNVKTLVCPGQGNISPHLFKLPQHEVDTVDNAKYKDLVRLSGEVLPAGINIGKYFSAKTYPAEEICSHELTQTSVVQPLVLLATYLNYSILQDKFDFNLNNCNYMLGHSLGELSCLVLQGIITIENGLQIAHKRGKLMEEALAETKEEWGMCALLFRDCDFKIITKICQDLNLEIANINGYEQIVVSGKVVELNKKLEKLEQIQHELIKLKQLRSKVKKRWLQTKIPAHNSIFKGIGSRLKDDFKIQKAELAVPIVCNLNGLIYMKDVDCVIDNFLQNTSKPVQFVSCLETIRSNSKLLHPDETCYFLNLSDVTNGLTKRFFKKDPSVESYDLISEAVK